MRSILILPFSLFVCKSCLPGRAQHTEGTVAHLLAEAVKVHAFCRAHAALGLSYHGHERC